MKVRVFVFAILMVACATEIARATTMVRLSLDQLTQAATVIVHGRVVGQVTRWNELHSRIVTITTLAVDQALKGNTAPTVEIEQLGGTLGDMHVYVPGTVRFLPEGDYLLFLEPSTPHTPRYVIVGMMQGAFRVYREEASQQNRVILPMGTLKRARDRVQSELGSSGPTVPLPQFQQQIVSALNTPPAIPRGTSIAVVIRSTESDGVGRLHVVARTTSDIFPNAGLVIPAGSTVEGNAYRSGDEWKIHWEGIEIRGTRVPISAQSEDPVGGSLAERLFIVKVR